VHFEAFYRLACEDVALAEKTPLGKVAELAAQVRAAVWESYEIEPARDGANVVSGSGTTIPVPTNLVPRVAEFLREIDGKTTASAPGKEYEGDEVSEAEVRFKLSD
jgi:hypothetical protein